MRRRHLAAADRGRDDVVSCAESVPQGLRCLPTWKKDDSACVRSQAANGRVGLDADQFFAGRAQISHEGTRGSVLARSMRVTTYERSPATISCPRRYMLLSLGPFTVMKHCSPRSVATQRLIAPMVFSSGRERSPQRNLSASVRCCVNCRFVKVSRLRSLPSCNDPSKFVIGFAGPS